MNGTGTFGARAAPGRTSASAARGGGCAPAPAPGSGGGCRRCRPRRADLAPGAVGAELPGQHVVGQVDVEDLVEPVLQRRGRRPARAPRPGGRGCGASGRPSRCRYAGRPGPRRWRSGRCGSARGSDRRSSAPGCSRDRPGTPGRRQQMPRTIRSICTPACDAVVERVDQLGVDQAVHLQRRCGPVAGAAALAADQLGEPAAQVVGGDEQLVVARRRGRSR